MLNRTTALCLAGGVLAGYLAGGTSIRAQNVPAGSPITVFTGDDVQLQFERGRFPSENVNSMRCRVTAVEGSWMKCGTGDGFGVERTHKWVNLAYVVQVTKFER